MKIGMCMFLWTTKLGKEHEALLADIRQTGFEGVEVPIFEGRPKDYAATAKMLSDLGIEASGVAAMGDPALNLIAEDAATRQAGVDHMEWVLDCCAELGADQVCGPLHSPLGHFTGAGPTRAELDRSVESQRRIGDLAQARGVTVCLEALNRFECYLLNTMADLAAHIETIDHPNIRGMYDTFHANIEEADPVAALALHRDAVHHIHLSENDRGVPGRGHVPWQATFAAIAKIGYDGWLTIEAFGRGLPDLAAATKVWRDFAESPEAVYREGHAFIRQSLAQAGIGDPT
jgi:D-psicose/D-tagatose/L-ribulose 3-epimerase